MPAIIGAMDYRLQLLTLAEHYGVASGLSPARVATIVCNHGGFFERLRERKTCTVDTFLKVKRWFDENWPEGTPWPEGVDPPERLPRWSDNVSEDAA